MLTPRELKACFEQGKNISLLLRRESGVDGNTEQIIETAYELQTLHNEDVLESEAFKRHKEQYSQIIAQTIQSLCQPKSVLEAGIGEASTFLNVKKKLNKEVRSYGFDISWSRTWYAGYRLVQNNLFNVTLCTGSLQNIPFLDNAIDVVYTSHSIEPNGGKEKPILEELFRITGKYLLLFEPAYEFADGSIQKRMDSHGYCKRLKETAEELGYEVLEHKLLEFTASLDNPTAMIIIRKNLESSPVSEVFACPRFKTPLQKIADIWYSPEALSVYPVIGDIPCLRVDNAILASKYPEFMELTGT